MIPDCFGQSESPRATLGQQLLDKHANTTGQGTTSVADMGHAMGEKYMESLWKTVKMHENLDEDWYISEVIQHDTFLEGVMKVKHIARRTRPNPEWGLPHVEDAIRIMREPEGWDPKIVKDIVAFAKGELV